MQLHTLLMVFTAVNCSPKKFSPAPEFTAWLPFTWIDGYNRLYDDEPEIDTFFDRVVAITYRDEDGKAGNVTSGVLLTSDRVLASFNIFSIFARFKTAMTSIRVSALTYREVKTTVSDIIYSTIAESLVCGRQIIPIDYGDVSELMNHGRHRPRHDLAVLRLRRHLYEAEPIPPVLTGLKVGTKYRAGPIYTRIAKMSHGIKDDLRFVSLGHLSTAHMLDNRYLEKEEIHPDDNAIVDCDEWFPRVWGHFICLKNVNNYPGIASSALLFSKHRLVGVGAFALWKGIQSIFVFTDVRPYFDLILNTCTTDDQKLVMPKTTL